MKWNVAKCVAKPFGRRRAQRGRRMWPRQKKPRIYNNNSIIYSNANGVVWGVNYFLECQSKREIERLIWKTLPRNKTFCFNCIGSVACVCVCLCVVFSLLSLFLFGTSVFSLFNFSHFHLRFLFLAHYYFSRALFCFVLLLPLLLFVFLLIFVCISVVSFQFFPKLKLCLIGKVKNLSLIHLYLFIAVDVAAAAIARFVHLCHFYVPFSSPKELIRCGGRLCGMCVCLRIFFFRDLFLFRSRSFLASCLLHSFNFFQLKIKMSPWTLFFLSFCCDPKQSVPLTSTLAHSLSFFHQLYYSINSIGNRNIFI